MTAVCYLDHEWLAPECGRVLVDTGFTKLYHKWDAAGTARYQFSFFFFLFSLIVNRYIMNANVWLLGLEHQLLQGNDIVARSKRGKK
jgi:hypothetical protein